MESTLLSGEEVALRGKTLYENGIRRKVENEANIGKMVIIDIKSGEYEVDDMGIVSAQHLHAKRPDARLYGIRIGYNVAASFGGTMECII